MPTSAQGTSWAIEPFTTSAIFLITAYGKSLSRMTFLASLKKNPSLEAVTTKILSLFQYLCATRAMKNKCVAALADQNIERAKAGNQ